MWSGQDNDKINEHEILSGSSLEYFVQRQCPASPWFMLMPDAGNKSVPMSKTAYLEIKQAKEVLCFGGPQVNKLNLVWYIFVSCIEP